MWKVVSRHTLVVALLVTAGLAFGLRADADDGSGAGPADVKEIEFFQTQVKPILEAHCLKCHGGGSDVKGGLRLTSRAELLGGGESGPAVSLESPDESLLLEAINYEGYEMPPKGKLPRAKIEILARWVKMGLPWTPGQKGRIKPLAPSGSPPVNAQTMRFWSFQPVERPDVPKVDRPGWVTNPIDAFVLAKLDAGGLTPAKPASKVALLRRAYYDLTGLPPSPAEVEAFLADDSPEAYEKVIDRLLASPHYGEKWARHWLDIVRYAETNSFERDGGKPFVWRYRDYVIRSLNDDKPYDRFVREQLAGDELAEVTPDSIVATGYYRLGAWDDEPSDRLQALYDDLDDIVTTTSQVFLGLTINCARCHDHKLDPIPQADYYRLLAVFRNVRRYGVRGHPTVLDASVRSIATEAEQRRHAAEVAAHQKRLRDVEARLASIEESARDKLVGVERDDFKSEDRRVVILKAKVPDDLNEETFQRYVELTGRRDELRKFKPPGLAQALCVKEHGPAAPTTHVLVRGNPHVAGQPVEPGFPSVLNPPEPVIAAPPPGAQSAGRRLALARWIADRENPLTARVMVNRIWQHHFGRGIVRSPNNFGMRGTPPTHRRLLDWLAAEFVDRGWRMKAMHKLIMMSSTYRMSSQTDAAALAADPENNDFWRFDMRRLTAEELRDSILAVSGRLNRKKMYGPSIYPIIPGEVLAGQSMPGSGWGKSEPEDLFRRSIYIHIKRSLVTPILASFDVADTDTTCPVRFATTQPTQALGMLNSEFINDQAKAYAENLRNAAGEDRARQVALALARTLQRTPTDKEIERGVRLITAIEEESEAGQLDALAQFCLVALNLNEFIYLD